MVDQLPDAPTGVKFHNAYFGICSVDAAKQHREHASRAGGLSHAHVFMVQAAQTIAVLPDPVQLRADLMQLMKICLQWVDQIDQRRAAAQEAVHV